MWAELPSPARLGLGSSCVSRPRVVRRWIPEGDAGTFATLDAMEELVRSSMCVALTRQFAASIIGAASSAVARAQALKVWLTPRYRFAPDPLELEVVTAPDLQLCQYQTYGFLSGDCDDLAVTVAALGALAGLEPRFVVIALEPFGPFEHVWCELSTEIGWAEFDLVAGIQGIRPAQLGARRAVRQLLL